MVDLLIDVIKDNIKVVPIIFVVFLLVDMLKEKTNKRVMRKLSTFDVVGGGIMGIIPQCGIPVAMTNLYCKGVISFGVLMAVFLSSSDEALIIIGTHPDKVSFFIFLIVIKVVIGIGFGYLINLIIRTKCYDKPVKESAVIYNCGSIHGCGYESKSENLIVKNIKYTLKIFIFLVIIGFFVNLGMDKMGEDTLSHILGKKSLLQPIIAAFIGAIPSCASSVIVAQGYLEGAISFGALLAGLCANTGYGILILFRGLPLKQALKISGLLLSISILAGEFFC